MNSSGTNSMIPPGKSLVTILNSNSLIKSSLLRKDHQHDDENKNHNSSSTSIGSAGSGSIARPSLKRKEIKNKKVTARVKRSFSGFWTRFSCMFLSRMFLRHKNIVFLIIEVIAPVMVMTGLISAFTSSSAFKNAYYEKDMSGKTVSNTKFDPIQVHTTMKFFTQKYTDKNKRALILYTPVTNLTTHIMMGAMDLLHLDSTNPIDPTGQENTGVVGFESYLEMIEKALIHRNDKKKHGRPIGVEFDYHDQGINAETQCPYRLSFSIRHFDLVISDTKSDFPYINKPNRATSAYIENGFIGLQYAIQYSYFKHLFEKVQAIHTSQNDSALLNQTMQHLSDLPDLKLRQFYWPNFYNNQIRSMIAFITCFSLVIAYLFTSFFIVRQLVSENQAGIKELLDMHGMPIFFHWIILFVHAVFFRGITAALITQILFTNFGSGKILDLADYSLIFAIVWMHLLALTFFNFFLSSIIKSTSSVSAYATIIGLMSFVGPTSFFKFGLIEKFGNYILAMFFPNWALYNIFHYVINYECDDKRVSLGNVLGLYRDPKVDAEFLTIFEGLMILFGSAITYFFLAVYNDLTSQSKMFPHALSKWWDCCGKAKQKKHNQMAQKELLQEIKDGNFHNFEKPAIYEEFNTKKKCYVRVRHLCKRFGKHKMALDTVNLNILHEEITVILGQGGSGKSTLIQTLAGMVNPTAGYATVKDHDVIFDAKRARKFIGLCPQKLVYYNLLSVKEHVYLCYRLRGYNAADCTRNASTLLTRLRLWNIRNNYTDSMTNDELRRLNIAMAMADSPKVLLLDEPTCGMDIFGRREVWNILKRLKRHHTIILSTNYMDEAEYLGDKIVLLYQGRLVCYGSIEFLKKQYDTGYFLKIISFRDSRLDCQEILAMVKSKVGEGAVERKNSTIKDVDNLIIELPMVGLLKFAELCQEFEQNQIRMGIKKYSFNKIGLNDIFNKICESISTVKDAPDLYVRRDSADNIRSALTSQIPTIPEMGRYKPSFKRQLSALVRKRITYLMSNHDLVWQVLIPIGIIFMVMYEARVFVGNPPVPPARNMSLETFKKLEVLTKMPDVSNKINYAAHVKDVLGFKIKALSQNKNMLQTFSDLLFQNRQHDLGTIKEKHMIGLSFKPKGIGSSLTYEMTGYFGSGALHSAPLILNTMMNVIFSTLTQAGTLQYQIFAINHPFPLATESWAISHEPCGLLCVMFAVLLSFAFSFISTSSMIFPILERRTGLKHIQLMTGVSPWLYWFGHFVCDFAIMIFVTAFVGIIFCLDRHGTFGTISILILMCITILYLCWSGLAFSYFMSYVMPLKFRPSLMLMIHMMCLFVFIFLEFFFEPSSIAIVRVMFMIFPGFAITCAIQDWFNAVARRSFCQGLHPHIKDSCKSSVGDTHLNFKNSKFLYDHIMKTNVKLAQCCEKICMPANSCFKEPGILSRRFEKVSAPGLVTDMVALTITGFLYWILLIVAEKRYTNRISQKVVAQGLNSKIGRKLSKQKTSSNDADVKNENLRVNSIVFNDEQENLPRGTEMVIQGLTKCRKATIMLNNFNLEIKRGECIGILGAAGSGKSTLVRLIAGCDTPTKGMCYIQNNSLVKNRKKYLSSIGYCPEENALFDDFTGIQMIELLGRLRGIPEDVLSSHVAKWLQVVGLSEDGQDLCKAYGLDMKRRLCFAMSLIAQNCEILLLDEVTTGMSPLGRERTWAILEQGIKNMNNTVIFTSFYSEECINLATRLVVLAEGNAQCIGNPEEIQKKYAKGYCITFKMKHEILTRLDVSSTTVGKLVEFKKAVQETFAMCDLIDEQDNFLMYFLSDAKLFWGEVFRRMDALVSQYTFYLTSYDITEASIDDLFVLLTNKYRDIGAPRRFDIKTLNKEDDLELKTLTLAAKALQMKV